MRFVRLPPVLFLAHIVAGLLAHRVHPLPLGVPSFAIGLATGSAILLLAVLLAVSALRLMRRHGTTEEPGQRPSTLVTSGVFALTRNPIYVSQLLSLLGIALMADTAWLIVASMLLALALDRLVIREEEIILDNEFGQAYRAYRARVRRWI